MEKDQRRLTRKMFLTEVKYEGAGIRAETRISDINVNGVCIDKLSPLSVGCELKLSFTLPGGQLIEAEGVVMRSQPGMGMGAAFTRLKPEDVEQIREFIEK